MAIRLTRWSPDTCGCQIDIAWDDAVPQDSRTHSLGAVVRRDAIHAALADASVYVTVDDENRRKNRATGEAIVGVANSGEAQCLRENATWDFTGSGDTRVLRVHTNGCLSPQKVAQAQNACDAIFGVGKVVVD